MKEKAGSMGYGVGFSIPREGFLLTLVLAQLFTACFGGNLPITEEQ